MIAFRKKTTALGTGLLLLTTTMLTVAPTPSHALFGFTCIPRLQNCMCTYLRPCPVIDITSRITTGQLEATTEYQAELQEEVTNLLQEMNKGISCNSVGSLPGMNALSIDINSLIRSQLPNLSLDELEIPGLDSLRRQLEDVNLNASMLQDVISGNMTPSQFIDLAEQAGVDMGMLEDMGITLSSLQGLATGNVDSLMSMGIDRIQNELGSFGLNTDILEKLASGEITTETFLDAASSVGLDVPQLSDMGLNLDTLNALSSGDLSVMGLPSMDAVLAQVPRIDISPRALQDMLGGQMDPQRLLDMAEASGLGPMTLESMGVSPQTLSSIASGALSPQQLLEFSSALNFQGVALESLGINESLLSNIATGELSPNSIMNIANGAGLELADLQGLGLDPSSLTDMIGQGPSGLMSTLQGAGMGNPTLDALGLDAGMLGDIASGALPASAINDLVAGTGLDPNAIVIPGLDGPITALGGLQDGLNAPIGAINDQLSEIGSQVNQMLNIPVPSIPGLGGLLGSCGAGVNPDLSVGGGLGGDTSGSGAPGPGGTTTPAPTGGGGDGTGGGGDAGTAGSIAGTGVGSGAVCSPNRPLISETQPPHDMNFDLANLDFGLAGGGDIFQQEEAIADAEAEANRIYAAALARAIVMRPLFTEALDSIGAIEEQMLLIDQMGTTEEAWRMNSSIKVHLLSSLAEKASLRAYILSLNAAPNLNGQVFTPIPIFPHNSQWEEDMAETVRPAAQAIIDQSARSTEASAAYNDFFYQAREVKNSFERIQAYDTMAETIPEVVQTINDHESQKESLYHMEEQLRANLEVLYIDPDAAWEILEADLKANSGDYMTGNKWQVSRTRADSFSNMLDAQTDTTRYGQRIMIDPGNPDGDDPRPPTYSSVSEQPYSYAYVNSRIIGNDPIEAGPTYTGGGGDDDPPPNPALSGPIQVYMAAERREKDWAPRRRGNSADGYAMSGALWQEMLDFAPECLTGPIPTTSSNLLDRPELFDLDAQCTHLIWTDGDAEDYISSANLGGADAILWQSKIQMDTTLLMNGASSSTELTNAFVQQAQAALAFENANNIESELRSVEYVPAANHTAELKTMIQDMIDASSTFEGTFTLPRIQP